MSSTSRITKSKVDGLEAPASGQVFLRDSELKGFAVRITAGGTRSFIIEKRIDGKLRRFTLAKYPELTVEQARKLAQAQLGKIATGGDPIAERRNNRRSKLTLSQAFADFAVARKNLSAKTMYLYAHAHNSLLADWSDRALVDITSDQVLKKHHELGETRGGTTANFAMQFLSSLFGFARDYYEGPNGQPVVVRNPVDAIRRNRSWYPSHRRQTVITPDQLPAWYRAVQTIGADPASRGRLISNYLLLLLFSGLRRNEGAFLKVGDIDLSRRLLTIERTKNGKPHTLPLSSFLMTHLAPLIEGRVSTDYVFSMPGDSRPLPPPYLQTKLIKQASGVAFTLHDLRRTFVTVAERLDVSMLAIKRLVNHSDSDVTSGYVVMDTERLRAPMELISNTLVRYLDGGDSAQVLRLNAA